MKHTSLLISALAWSSTLLFVGCQPDEEVAPVTPERALPTSEERILPPLEAESTTNLRTAPLMNVNNNVGGCTTELLSYGSVSLGGEAKLRPIAHGTGDLNGQDECDYFVGFPSNFYNRIVVVYYPSETGSLDLARRIQRLIVNPPTRLFGKITGGGFDNGLAKAELEENRISPYPDNRVFIVFGNGRTDAQLLPIANTQGVSVSELLAKYVRLGN